jgi:3-oxoacyl-[acyl-carrier protein] reductase
VTQPLLARMLRRGAGRVVAALSAVVLGAPPRGFSSYTTAKYALLGYLKCLAAEYATRGIVTATVSPGAMPTGLLRDLPALLTDQMRAALPRGEWIDPAAVARAVFWLAAEAGPEVNGANLPLTGGTTA